MLLEFSVANYRSFRDMTRFSMVAAPKRANDGGLDEANVFESNGMRVLKTKGVYGLNASGKSNLIGAFSVLNTMINKSVAEEGLSNRFWEERFKLLLNWDEQPMFFQIIFTKGEKTFRYGFQIRGGLVDSEWLFLRANGKETHYLTRTLDAGITVSNEFQGASEFVNLLASGNNEIFRNDALFLTGAALMGNSQAMEVRFAIRTIYLMNGISDKWSQEHTKKMLRDRIPHYIQPITELMKAAETGTQALSLSTENNSNEGIEIGDELSKRSIISTKSKYDEAGNVVEMVEGIFNEWESAGTQKWLYTSTVIISVLFDGATLIIDEFDAQFHPNLTLKIVNLFNNPRTNPHNAQLIFATHDTGLLRRAKLRRDQICFVDKDKYGVSSMRTLIEYKGVRKDESYEKEYLEGNYGAVAYLDDIDDIIADFLIKSNDPSENK